MYVLRVRLKFVVEMTSFSMCVVDLMKEVLVKIFISFLLASQYHNF